MRILAKLAEKIGVVNFLGTVNIGELRIDGGLAPQEYRNRQALLDKVKQSWIGVLERSLANQARLELGLEQRFDALALDYETPEHPRQPLPKGTKVSEKFFDRLGVGRTLLILGAPGSGKTTTLLELARDLINRVEQEGYFPLPIVLNLSLWAAKQESLEQWILQELEGSTYKISDKKSAKSWLKEGQLILLLDGLDEVKSEARNACVTAINRFQQNYGGTDIVVCSRITDYENLTNRLQFQTAIFIQPLTPTQIEEYLNQAGNSLAGVKQALQTDAVLQEMVQAPLMLSVIALAYEGFPPEALPQIPFEERQKHLWDKYIQRMLKRRKSKQYLDEQAVHWLKFLAQQMIQESKTVFLIERMQPSWLSILIGEKTHTTTIDISIKGLFYKQFVVWDKTSFFIRDVASIEGKIKTDFSLNFLRILLVIGLINNEFWTEIKPIERLNWSRNRAIFGFGLFLFAEMLIVLIFILLSAFFGRLDNLGCNNILREYVLHSTGENSRELLVRVMMCYRHGYRSGYADTEPIDYFNLLWLFTPLVIPLYFGTLVGFNSSELEITTRPNQGIWIQPKTL